MWIKGENGRFFFSSWFYSFFSSEFSHIYFKAQLIKNIFFLETWRFVHKTTTILLLSILSDKVGKYAKHTDTPKKRPTQIHTYPHTQNHQSREQCRPWPKGEGELLQFTEMKSAQGWHRPSQDLLTEALKKPY